VRRVVMVANRNGFFYVLDRTNGELLLAKPFVHTTWATEVGADGRPVLLPPVEPPGEGNLTCPDNLGGTNFMSPSFDPSRGLFFVTARETCGRIYPSPMNTLVPGVGSLGGMAESLTELQSGALRAIDPTTGRIRWQVPYAGPGWAGVLSTDSGLVFTADDRDRFMAVDADTGRVLWDHALGEDVHAAPLTYTIDGRQYVTIGSASTFTSFALPPAP
jgi:alcohol dehydrogenase (cytochrome c)